MSIIGCSGAWAADGEANDALLKKLEKMEQRIQMLEGKLKQKQAAAQADAAGCSPVQCSAHNICAANRACARR